MNQFLTYFVDSDQGHDNQFKGNNEPKKPNFTRGKSRFILTNLKISLFFVLTKTKRRAYNNVSIKKICRGVEQSGSSLGS